MTEIGLVGAALAVAAMIGLLIAILDLTTGNLLISREWHPASARDLGCSRRCIRPHARTPRLRGHRQAVRRVCYAWEFEPTLVARGACQLTHIPHPGLPSLAQMRHHKVTLITVFALRVTWNAFPADRALPHQF